MRKRIDKALAALDPENDDLWTADGLPRVYAVSEAVEYEVTRKQITDAAPEFIRPGQSEEAAVAVATLPEEEIEDFEVQPEPSEAPEEKPKDIQWPDPPPAPTADEAKAYVDAEKKASKNAAFVEPLDQVVALHQSQVYRDVDLVDRGIAEFGRQADILVVRREEILRKIVEVGRRGALLSKRRNRMPRGSEQSKHAETIKRYLRVQNESRAKRADAARKFIEAGTTAQDVKAQLEGPSKLDAAMKHRKPTRSAVRPVYPRATGT